MNYEVFWTRAAENDLATIWIATRDQAVLTAVAARLEELLADAPLRLGQPRTSSIHRVAYLAPLGVEFQVIEDDKRVIVQAAFTFQ